MDEKVDYQGRSNKGRDSYYWDKAQTRLTNLLNENLHYRIDNAVKDALKPALELISQGVTETAKITFEEAAKTMQIDVKLKR